MTLGYRVASMFRRRSHRPTWQSFSQQEGAFNFDPRAGGFPAGVEFAAWSPRECEDTLRNTRSIKVYSPQGVELSRWAVGKEDQMRGRGAWGFEIFGYRPSQTT